MGWLQRRDRLARSIDVGWLVVGLAVAIVVVLSLYRIAAKSFWYDEAFALAVARSSPLEILATILKSEVNGSAYYVVLTLWRSLGETETRIRFLSVLFAAATIPLLYIVGRRHVGATAAGLACLLFAISPFVIEYAQEARMYAMVLFVSTVLVLAWSFATDGDRARWWVAYGLASIVALYTHLFCGFVILGLGLTWLAGAVPRTRNGFWAQSAIVLAGLPLGVYILQSGSRQIDWILPISDAGVSVVLGAFGAGSLVLSAILFGGAFVAIATRNAERLRRLAPLIAWWLTPLVLGLAISLARSLLERRYFIVALPPLLLLASAGFVRVGSAIAGVPGRRATAVVALVLVGILVAGPLAAWYAAPRWDWRGAADWIARSALPGDRLVFIEPDGEIPLRQYLDGYTDTPPLDLTPDEVRATAGRTWLVLYLFRDTGFKGAEATFPGYRVVESKLFQGARVQLLDRSD